MSWPLNQEQFVRSKWPSNPEVPRFCAVVHLNKYPPQKKKKTPYVCSVHTFGFWLHIPWQRSSQVWSSRRGVLLSARDWSGRHPATVSHQWGGLKTTWVSTMLYYPTEASVFASTTRPVLQSHRQVAARVIISLGEKYHYPAPVFHFSL